MVKVRKAKRGKEDNEYVDSPILPCIGMELYWRDTATCPTEEEFIEMVDNSMYASPLYNAVDLFFFWYHPIETGGLLRLAVKLMQAASTSTQ